MKQRNIKKLAAALMLLSFIFGTVSPAMAAAVVENGKDSGGTSTKGVIIYDNTVSSSSDIPNANDYSTAMGVGTNAVGYASTAMGQYTIAQGDYSTAMGNRTYAIGEYSTAMGGGLTSASGYASTSMGYGTTASGPMSTSIGNYAVASGSGSFAGGGWAEYDPIMHSYKGQSGGHAYGKSSFAFGTNAVAGDAGDSAKGTNAISMGYHTVASGDYSFAGGKGSRAYGKSSFAFGDRALAGTSSALTGNNTIAIGSLTATGIEAYYGSLAKAVLSGSGTDFPDPYSPGTFLSNSLNQCLEQAKSSGVIADVAAEKASILAMNDNNAAVRLAEIFNNAGIGEPFDTLMERFVPSPTGTMASGENAIAIGNSLTANGTCAEGINSMALGNDAKATGINSLAVGTGANAKGQGAMAIGASNAEGYYSTAIGYKADTNGSYSTAIGWGATTSNAALASTAIGTDARAVGEYSMAMGTGSMSVGYASTAIGNNARAEGEYSTAMGYGTGAEGNDSTAMGTNTIAKGKYSTAMGNYTRAIGDYSTTMGFSTDAVGDYATAMGSETAAKGIYSTSAGYKSHANGSASFAGGGLVVEAGSSTFVVGGGKAYADGSFAFGSGTVAGTAGNSTSGKGSVAMGTFAQAVGDNTFALGWADPFKDTTTLSYMKAGLKELALNQAKYADICENWEDDIMPYMLFIAPEVTSIDDLANLSDANARLIIDACKMTFGFTSDAQMLAESLGEYLPAILGTTASGENAIAMGASTTPQGTIASGANSIAIGTDAKATHDNSVALGNNAVTKAAQNVTSATIGTKTYNFTGGTSAEGVVSVGDEGHLKQIVNVANGAINSGSTDAVNGGQIFDIISRLPSGSGGGGEWTAKIGEKSLTVNSDKPMLTFLNGDGVIFEADEMSNSIKISATGGGEGSEAIKAGVRVEADDNAAKAKGKGSIAEAYNSAVSAQSTAGIAIGYGATVGYKGGEITEDVTKDTAAVSSIAIGENSRVEGANSVAIGYNNVVTGAMSTSVGYKNEVSGDRSGAFGDPNIVSGSGSYAIGNDNEIAGNNNFVLGSNVKITDKNITNSVALGNNSKVTGSNEVSVGDASKGITRKITNVAKAENDTDAVNYVQMKDYVAEHGGSDPAIRQELNAVAGEVKEVGAISAALAGLHFVEPTGEEGDKFVGAVAYGNYRGESAGAIGVAYKPNPNFMLSASTSVGNSQNAYNAGVSLKFGKGETAKTRAELQKQVKYLNDKNNALESTVAAQSTKLAEQDERIKALEELVNTLIKK